MPVWADSTFRSSSETEKLAAPLRIELGEVAAAGKRARQHALGDRRARTATVAESSAPPVLRSSSTISWQRACEPDALGRLVGEDARLP
jgi:hypothetical protein